MKAKIFFDVCRFILRFIMLVLWSFSLNVNRPLRVHLFGAKTTSLADGFTENYILVFTSRGTTKINKICFPNSFSPSANKPLKILGYHKKCKTNKIILLLMCLTYIEAPGIGITPLIMYPLKTFSGCTNFLQYILNVFKTNLTLCRFSFKPCSHGMKFT